MEERVTWFQRRATPVVAPGACSVPPWVKSIRAVACVLVLWGGTAEASASKDPKGAEEALIACKSIGEGYFRIPDTDTCLRIGGGILAEATGDFSEHEVQIAPQRVDGVPDVLYAKVPIAREVDRYSMRVDARVSANAITQTDYGNLNSFLSLRNLDNPSASDRGGTDSSLRGTLSSNTVQLDQAWIKLGNFTAGHHPSYFDFLPGLSFTEGYASSRMTNLVSVTQPIGDTVTLALSAEDTEFRRRQDGVWAQYSGQRAPDVVVAGRLAQPWGRVHAAAALHQIEARDNGWELRGPVEADPGWAVTAGAEYNLRTGDRPLGRIVVSAAYAEGAIDYLGMPNFSTDYIMEGDGRLRKTTGLSGLVAYEHFWTPRLRSVLSASGFSAVTETSPFDWKTYGWLGQAALEYTPVPGLTFGTETNYYLDAVRSKRGGQNDPLARVGFMTALIYARSRF